MHRNTSDVERVEVRLELVADSWAPRAAREVLRRVVADRPAWFQEDASLLLSEVVTNSVQHGPSEPGDELAVLLVIDEGTLRVEVSDQAPELPARKPPTSERGNGLGLVEAIATRWGAERRGDWKVTWFEMLVPPR